MDVTPRLKELTVFKNSPQLFGLPRSLFIGLVILCGGEGFLLGWWVGLLLFVVTYAPLYRAHQTDPQALAVWAAAFRDRIGAIDPAQTRYLSSSYE